MKTLLYAKATKVVAVLLFITCVTMGVLTALGGILRISRENHNLDRARNQFKLVSDMEKALPEMHKIVEKYAK